MLPGFGRQPLGHRLLGGFQLHDHAGEPLRQRVVDVARHAIALGHHGGLAALRGEAGQLDRQHRLIGQGLGQFHFFGPKPALLGEPNPDHARHLAGNQHRHDQYGNDALRQQMGAPRKVRAFPDILQHARLARAEDFRPGPNVFDVQRGTDLGNDFVRLGHEPALFKGEFESQQTADAFPPPHTAARTRPTAR